MKRLLSPILGKKFGEQFGEVSVAQSLEALGEKTGIAEDMNQRSMEKFGVPIGTAEEATAFDIGDKESSAYRGSKAIFEIVEAAS